MSKTLPTTLTDFSVYATEQFLQTAVFIDDKIYDQKLRAVVEPTALQKPLPLRKLALKSVKHIPSEKVEVGNVSDAQEYSPHDILTSFAKKRIVCSLYQPTKEASVGFSSDAYHLCVAADIVIVDWDLYGDYGAKAKELISNLIHQSLTDVPEQLRLVLIYTSVPNLTTVANEIYEALAKVIPSGVDPKQEDKGLALHTQNTRVAIIGKPGRRLDEYRDYEEAEKNLATRAIKEFAKLASGLLQGAILLGLAKIRGNSRKILSKFDSAIDPAFLTHRALSLPDEEASDHVIPLLVAEIQSVLEDSLPNSVITSELISDWCQSQWQPQAHAKSFIGDKIDIREFAENFCLSGVDIKDKYQSMKKMNSLIKKDGSWSTNDRNTFKQLVAFLHPVLESKENCNLAILMSQRTHYSEKGRDLSLGTIVRCDVESRKEYLICLQPICDSVRLADKRSFIFCILQSVDIDGGQDKISHVVVDDSGLVGLRFKPKSFNSLIAEFVPDSETKTVIARQHGAERFYFTSTAPLKYFWIAQLKAEHAQRAVEQFASDLSRVGLTESEWLRLMAK